MRKSFDVVAFVVHAAVRVSGSYCPDFVPVVPG
jgi:hypothetical protein